MWNDLSIYWKYLVGLFAYSILLVLPIYLNINTLASSITGTTNQLLHMAYLYYVLNILWNGYFLFNIDKQWSNRKRRYEKGKTNVEWYGFKLDVLFTA
jgi:hypothetical protein